MDTKEPLPALFKTLRTLGLALGVIGVIGLLLTLSDMKTFYQAYLYGWMFWISMTIGCYGFMLLHNIVRGSWGFPVIRLFEAGAKLMPIMGIAFLPILVAAYNHMLYPWADPTRVAADAMLRYRAHWWFYFSFFTLRNVIYFVIFTMWTAGLTYLSKRQDRTGDLSLIQNRINLAAPGFVAMVLLVTFAATDWVMSLDPHWYSTIYGFWFIACSGLTALAFITLLACLLKMGRVEPYWSPEPHGVPESNRGLVTKQVTRDLGNLLLTLSMVWAYFSLSQFLITWAGNLPNEITYYVKRNNGILAWVSAFLVTFQFFVPFLLLLSGRTKRTPVILAAVTLLILGVRVLEVAWNVIPMFHPTYADIGTQLKGLFFYVAAFLGIGGWWLVGFVTNLTQNGLIPVSDLPAVEVAHHGA